MFNLEPILFVAGGALVFLGPKELPNIARMLGYASGRAVGNIFQAKAKFNQVTKEANLHELHQEVEQSMQQLGAIRDEIRGGINPFRPDYQAGPIARSAMEMAGGLDSSGSRTDSAAAASSRDVPLGATWPSGAASAFHHRPPPTADMPFTSGERIRPLPLSAVSVGMAPSRTETATGGADFIMDSVMERKVGFEAQGMIEKLEQQHARGDPPS